MGKFHREPFGTDERINAIYALEDNGVIGSDMATALVCAAYQQCQIDYDAMARTYRDKSAPEELKELMVDLGVVLLLTEDQVRRVKYGV